MTTSAIPPPNSAVSPYQMMLEEMKKNEQKNGEGIARPTIQELEDSLLFKAGEMTVEDREEEMRDTYFAFADKLENMMHNT